MDISRSNQFWAAVFLILLGVAYVFVCAWHKPVIDLSAPILSIITLLLGYYWGSSKGSADKSAAMNNVPDPTIEALHSQLDAAVKK